MPHDLSSIRVYAPADPEDHALVTQGGAVWAVAVNDPEYTVGDVDTGMIGFGPGSWLPASGLNYPQPASKQFELAVLHRAGRNHKRRLEGVADALTFGTDFWRPDGLMLPLARGAAVGVSRDRIDAVLYPRRHNWQHPLLDRLTTPAVYAAESLREVAPVVASTPNRPLSVPFGPARMPTGSLLAGVYCDDPLLYSVASIGGTVTAQGQPRADATGMFGSLGLVYGHVGATRVQLESESVTLRLFALVWRENGTLRLYTQTGGGLTVVETPLGTVPTFGVRELSLATVSGVGAAEGSFMPGAPRLGDGVPFVTHRAMTEPEVRDALGIWYQHLTGFSTYTPAPLVPSLELLQPDAVQLVLGVPKTLTVTARRVNGLSGPITLTAVPDNIALRVSPLIERVDNDPLTDIFQLTLTPEAGLTLGDHTVTFTATTASGLRSAVTLQTRVLAEAPALPAGTTHFHALFDPTSKRNGEMVKNTGSTGTAGNLVMGGLTRFSSAYDAIVGDGSEITGYGPSIVTVDNYVPMAGPHTVSWTFWDVDRLPVNSVLFAVASQTNKFDFWQVYKDTAGLKLRVSKGTTVQAANVSSQTLGVTGGVLHLSVRLSGTSVTLENPTTDQSATLTNPGLTGSGRLTLFGTKLSDGSVQGLSQGVALVGSAQNVLV